MYKILLIIILALGLIPSCSAKHKFLEKDFQNKWCSDNMGKTEFVLDTGKRVDCVTDKYGVEVEFAYKFYESVGQSLYYNIKLNQIPEYSESKPAILLILEKSTDKEYLDALNLVAERYRIKVFTITKEDLK
jgi:hypothetical protein